MRLIDPMIMEFDRECATTRKLLARVPADKLDFRPHEKSMPLGKLASHLATLPRAFGATLLDDGLDFAAMPPELAPKDPESIEALLATFDAGVVAAKSAMSKLDDATAMGSWKLRQGDKVFVEMPRIAIARSILINHSIHHRGQLSVYLRILGVPIPSIYGPSADDNPFA